MPLRWYCLMELPWFVSSCGDQRQRHTSLRSQLRTKLMALRRWSCVLWKLDPQGMGATSAWSCCRCSPRVRCLSRDPRKRLIWLGLNGRPSLPHISCPWQQHRSPAALAFAPSFVRSRTWPTRGMTFPRNRWWCRMRHSTAWKSSFTGTGRRSPLFLVNAGCCVSWRSRVIVIGMEERLGCLTQLIAWRCRTQMGTWTLALWGRLWPGDDKAHRAHLHGRKIVAAMFADSLSSRLCAIWLRGRWCFFETCLQWRKRHECFAKWDSDHPIMLTANISC